MTWSNTHRHFLKHLGALGNHVKTQLGIRVDRVLKHVRAIEKSGDVPTKARTHTHITLTYTKP